MNEITNYPLYWPNNVSRVAPHLRGTPKFDNKSLADGVQFVLAEINRLNKRSWNWADENVVISTNVKPKLSGLPSGREPEPADSGVAGYFQLRFLRNGKQFSRPCVLTCDKWRKVSDNM